MQTKSPSFIGFHLISEPYGRLSNWWPCSFMVDGKRYCSSEQYMMEQKALLFGDAAIARAIMAETDPKQIQKLGKLVSGFDPVIWDGHKQLIMYRGLLAKFGQNFDLREELLSTGDARLAECSLSDKIWGIGLHADAPGVENPANWKGQNLLGFTLEAVREALKK